MAYLDWNATAPLLPAAREAWDEAFDRFWANPSTPYRLGVQARLALEEAREKLAALLGVAPAQLVFTSGATESNNAFLREAARQCPGGGEVWISAVEHPSVREAAIREWGAARVCSIPVDLHGRVDMDWFRERLAAGPPALVSVMAVNNETGVIQPVREIAALCHRSGVPLHTDAVQWIGKCRDLPLGPEALAGLAASGHKFGGPKGTGFIILGAGWSGLRLQAGGAQEGGARSGTENVPGILAMTAALLHRLGNPAPAALGTARDAFEEGLLALWDGDVHVHGRGAPRVWNTSSVSLPVYRSERWISRLDRHGFQVSSGSACSHGKEGPTAVLRAMAVDAETASRTLRVSGGWETSPQDWQALLEALRTIRGELDEAGPASGFGKVIQI